MHLIIVLSVNLVLRDFTLFKQHAATREVRGRYKETGDIDLALKQFPHYLVAERALVSFSCKLF